MKRFLNSRWGTLLTICLFAAACELSGNRSGLAFLPVFGTVGAVAGHPDFTAATGSGKIPWLFSRKAIVKFYDESVLPFISQRDYEGEIKALGDKITIDTIPTITISKYTKGMNLNDWQDVDSPKVDMYINRATIFKFKMDSKRSPLWQ